MSDDDTLRRTGVLMGKRPDWSDQAFDNVDRWGTQGVATLFLAMVEELGEVADVLDRRHIPQGDDVDDAVLDARILIEDMASLGIRTRDYLEAAFEDADGQPLPDAEREAVRDAILDDVDADPVQDELDDLMALGVQLTWALQDERDGE